ncbi:MAG TPA: hypothetical protein VN688_28600 [Gemmataceae bacterium]|nr:hypothetical protein [Gemmataceae bacterium]
MHLGNKKGISLALTAALVLSAATVVHAAGWGTIKGQVVWDGGAVPKPVEIKVDKDKDHCLSKGAIYKEDNTFVVNPKNKGVRWAVVYLMSEEGFSKPIPIHPALKNFKKVVEVDQPCCKFEPHVLALQEGQTLLVKNSAPIVHNVNVQGGTLGPSVNPILPAGRSLKLDDIKARQLPISISCSIHGWMAGKVFVLKNPYFAVTDEDGKFEIKNAPAGKFRLVIWQEGMGWVVGDKGPSKKGKSITIKAGATNDLGKIPVKPSKD